MDKALKDQFSLLLNVEVLGNKAARILEGALCRDMFGFTDKAVDMFLFSMGCPLDKNGHLDDYIINEWYDIINYVVDIFDGEKNITTKAVDVLWGRLQSSLKDYKVLLEKEESKLNS